MTVACLGKIVLVKDRAVPELLAEVGGAEHAHPGLADPGDVSTAGPDAGNRGITAVPGNPRRVPAWARGYRRLLWMT